MKDKQLLGTFNEWHDLSMFDEDVIAYQSRLKYLLDEEAKYDHAKHLGEKEGVLKVAKELAALNIDIETIQKATGLPLKDIENLSR